MKVELDLSNYGTKTNLKKATGVDTSDFAKKVDLASLKLDVDELDIDKLKTVPVDLSKLSNVVDNDVVKKTVFDKLVAKVNAIFTNRFVLKTHYNTDKSGLEKKIHDTSKKIVDASRLVIEPDYNAKITDIEGKIPRITGLAATAALNAVNNKIPSVSNLLKKTNYDAKNIIH